MSELLKPVRTPTDGKPFYCALCGLGWGEFMACEEVDCRLESEAEASLRKEGNGRG
jgi:hypothetical protein